MTRKYAKPQARKDLPRREARDNKTRGGKTLIWAGSRGMWGAAVLSATAAARVGAGYVFLFSPSSTFPSARHPDFLTLRSRVELDRFSALAIGPGLEPSPTLQRALRGLLKTTTCPVVVDAGALTALARMKNIPRLPDHWILTPHEGELSRLIGVPSGRIRENRLRHARLAHEKWGGVLLLKGAGTLIVSDGGVFEIHAGNPALAKAGTGDVLTGMIAGFLSQGLSAEKAACLAAFVHGKIADDWVKSGKDVLSLMASDILSELPAALARLRRD